MINEALSHYRILRQLGSGGMGAVYLAEDTRLRRSVALKILPGNVSADEEARRRFTQEARAASALNHPNIIGIYDIGSDKGHDFIVMEFVDGEQLRGPLPRKKDEIKRALEFVAQVASGLAAAHRVGICHRDIKPDNLMVTRSGQVKILDFGLAKLNEKQSISVLNSESPTTPYSSEAHPETKPGMILGTVAYMSPEQAEGRTLDHRTDIFSLGIVLYELLAGERPFHGKSAVEVLHQIISEQPRPLTELNPSLPTGVTEIIEKALAKDVNERYQHVGDFELDLRRAKRALDATPPAVSQISKGTRASLIWKVLGALLVAGAITAAWRIGRNTTVAPTQNVSLTATTLMPFVVDPDYDGEPSFSPDGQTIAYVTNRTGNFEIFRKQISGGAEINLSQNGADDVQPAFSPDGSQIAFVSTRTSSSQLIYRNANYPLLGGDIWVMPALGGLPRRIAEGGNFPSWSPDGSTLIYTSGPQGSRKILTVSASGGEAHEIPINFKALTAQTFFYPSYSSDGRWIVFEAQVGDLICVVSATGGVPIQIARGRRPVWNANSTAVIYSSGDPGKNYSLWQVPFSLTTGVVAGEATPLTISRGRDTQAAVSRDGRWIAFAGQDVDFNIERIQFDAETGGTTGTAQGVTFGHSLNYFFDVSPDRHSVVFESHRGSSYSIWRMDIGERGANQLTSDTDVDDHLPKWSPDGRSIGFTRKGIKDDDAKSKLWLMAQDGGNPQPVVEGVQNYRWTSDGNGFVYYSSVDRQLYFVDIKTKNKGRLTNEAGVTGQFTLSADGRWIVYQSTLNSSTIDVRAVSTSGGPSRAVVESPREDYHPFFSPSGKWIYYQPDHKNLYRVPGPSQGWAKTPPQKVTNFQESGLFLEDPQISRDGHELFYSRAHTTGDIWLIKTGQPH